MKYGPKWIEENLGIKRSTLRVYEKNGLLPHKYKERREYTEEELEWIWVVKILTGIGFSHKELREATETGDLDIRKGLSKHLTALEHKRDEIEKNIRYLKEIKRFGRIPTWPKENLERYEDFQERAKLAIAPNDEDSAMGELSDAFVNLLENASNKNAFVEFARALTSDRLEFPENLEDLQLSLTIDALLRTIASKETLEPHDPFVQALVRALYEASEEMAAKQGYTLTPSIFARNNIATLTSFGDLTLLSRAQLGEKGCEYAAKAIAIFAGYKEPIDAEWEGGLNLSSKR